MDLSVNPMDLSIIMDDDLAEEYNCEQPRRLLQQ